MLVYLAFLLACGSHESSMEAGCEPTLTPTLASGKDLGFSAMEAVVMMAGNLPETMVWDEMTQGDAETDISVSIAIDGSPSIAEPGGDASLCPEKGTWLRIPVAMQFTLAGGDVQASGTTSVDVGALDLARVWLNSGWDLPASLGGNYAAEFDAYFSKEYASRGFSLEGTWVTFSDTWAHPVFDIEFQSTSPDAESAAVAWRGSWTLHTLAVEDCLPTYGDHCDCEPKCLTAEQIAVVQADGVCDLGCMDEGNWECTIGDGVCEVVLP